MKMKFTLVLKTPHPVRTATMFLILCVYVFVCVSVCLCVCVKERECVLCVVCVCVPISSLFSILCTCLTPQLPCPCPRFFVERMRTSLLHPRHFLPPSSSGSHQATQFKSVEEKNGLKWNGVESNRTALNGLI